jgi:hypothetical protein
MAPELSFAVESAAPVLHAASPRLALRTRIDARPLDCPIHSVLLECQIRLEPARRGYSDEEASGLYEIFGARELWGRTQHSLLWTQVTVFVGEFVETTLVEIPIACSYDFDLATTKYFQGLRGGEIPVVVLFSGSAFYESQSGALAVTRIAWTEESRFRLPHDVYAETMAHYYPNQRAITLGREAFERLRRYRLDAGHHSWDGALAALLSAAEAER